jgi:hypothetical protein
MTTYQFVNVRMGPECQPQNILLSGNAYWNCLENNDELFPHSKIHVVIQLSPQIIHHLWIQKHSFLLLLETISARNLHNIYIKKAWIKVYKL